jgi:hypothetical protein
MARDFTAITTPEDLCDALHEARIVGVVNYKDSLQLHLETPLGEEFGLEISASVEMQGKLGRYLLEPCLGIRVIAESGHNEEDLKR